MKAKRTILIISLILIITAGILIFILRPESSDEGTAASLYIPENPGIAVEAVTAGMGKVIPEIKSSGLIRGRNEAVIISETRGVIKEVYEEIGAYVRKDDPIMSVDSSLAGLSMRQAEQQLKSAEIDYQSVKRAYENGSASESEMLKVQSQLAGAEALFEDTVNRYQNSVIKAPVDGFLADLESSLSVGNYISEGVRIGRVIDITSVKVDLFLGDDEVSRIRIGAEAFLEAGGKSLTGRVEAIALSSDKSTGSFRVIIEAENPYGAEMRSGFAADVSINEVVDDERIIIPASSVFTIGLDDYVYTVEDNKAVIRKIRKGAVSGNRQEVVSGLAEGETVIVSGFKSLSDGAEVVPRLIITSGAGNEYR